jgi:hypothetical protein
MREEAAVYRLEKRLNGRKMSTGAVPRPALSLRQ